MAAKKTIFDSSGTREYAFFRHTDCEAFPCHEDVDVSDFNCLFCYCPLYHLGADCGGKFVTRDGVKDCSGCSVPHLRENYDYIIRRLSTLYKGD